MYGKSFSSFVRIHQTDVGLMPSSQESRRWDFLGLSTAESHMASMLAWLLVADAGLAMVVHCTLVLKMFHNTLNGTICGSITCSEVIFPAELPAVVYI